MSTKNIILLAVVVLIGLGVYFSFSNKNTLEENSMMEDGNLNEEAMMEDEKTMMDDEDGKMMEDDSMNDGSMMEDDSSTMMDASYSGDIIAGSTSPLIDFNKADYQKALAEEKLVVLYFFANWCPTCKEEVANALYPTFNDLDLEGVVGFRVNYNDNQTDNDEKDLAREFGVAYQHTKVFVKNRERILKSPESWNKGRYLEEINSALK